MDVTLAGSVAAWNWRMAWSTPSDCHSRVLAKFHHAFTAATARLLQHISPSLPNRSHPDRSGRARNGLSHRSEYPEFHDPDRSRPSYRAPALFLRSAHVDDLYFPGRGLSYHRLHRRPGINDDHEPECCRTPPGNRRAARDWCLPVFVSWPVTKLVGNSLWNRILPGDLDFRFGITSLMLFTIVAALLWAAHSFDWMAALKRMHGH